MVSARIGYLMRYPYWSLSEKEVGSAWPPMACEREESASLRITERTPYSAGVACNSGSS